MEGDTKPPSVGGSILQNDLEFFNATPWTKKILDQPQYHEIVTPFRYSHLTQEDTFFGETLNTNATIAHWLLLVHKKLLRGHGKIASSPTTNNLNRNQVVSWPSPSMPQEEADSILLADLGPGLVGFKNTLHGGAVSALLDQALTFCASLQQARSIDRGGSLYTAELSVKFLRPTTAPGVVAIECWLEAKSGRKWTIKGRLRDSNGLTLAEAKGVWILKRPEVL